MFVFVPTEDALRGGLQIGLLDANTLQDAVDEVFYDVDWVEEYRSAHAAKKAIERCVEEWTESNLADYEKLHGKLKHW